MDEALIDDLLEKSIFPVLSQYPYNGLHVRSEDGRILIEGDYPFSKQNDEGIVLQGDFNLRINIPSKFPDEIPIVSEISNTIPKDAGHHYNKDTDGFCLGHPHEIIEFVKSDSSLKGFIDQYLDPFLYFVLYLDKYGAPPWSALSHGAEGLLEYWTEYFAIFDKNVVIKILMQSAGIKRFWALNDFCPCFSGKKMKACHSQIISALSKSYSTNNWAYELNMIANNYSDIDDWLKKIIIQSCGQ